MGPARTLKATLFLLCAIVAAATWVPSAQAAHWCDGLPITINPTQAIQDERVPFSVVLANNQNASLNLTARIRFDWETQSTFWGTRTLPAGQGAANTYAKTITGAVGDHTVSVSIAGILDGEGGGLVACGNFVFPFRVQTVPGPPHVVAKASTLQGPPGLEIEFSAAYSGAVAPVAIEWRLGDGQIANGSTVRHKFGSPGMYQAQVVLTDARERIATDRLSITIAAVDERSAFGGLVDRPEVLVSTAALGLALAAFIVALRTGRRLRATDSQTVPSVGLGERNRGAKIESSVGTKETASEFLPTDDAAPPPARIPGTAAASPSSSSTGAAPAGPSRAAPGGPEIPTPTPTTSSGPEQDLHPPETAAEPRTPPTAETPTGGPEPSGGPPRGGRPEGEEAKKASE